MVTALARFFTERVFGPDRAAMLTTQLPATAAGQAERRDKQAAAIRRKIARLDSAETALITELETPADPGDPAAQALRQRIRARFTDLYTQRTTLETELAALQDTPAEHDNDPTLLDELPILGDILTEAPAALTERLLDAFDMQAVYNRDKNQVTIHATVTDATPQAIRDLLTDPRADHNTPPPPQPGTTSQDHVSHLTR
jgi:site-specific DNA recombinase